MVDTAAADVENNGRATKARLVENFYVSQSGERASRPQPDVVSVGKKFLESGHEEIIVLDNLPAEQLRQAAAFGLQQVGQNAYGASKDENERIDALQARWETIIGGRWAGEGRESGIRQLDVIEAYLLALKDRSGKEPTQEDRDRIRGLIDNGEINKDDLAANKAVAAKLAHIKAQRAAERAAKAAAAAEAEEQELPNL